MSSAAKLVVGIAVETDDDDSGDEPYTFDPARSIDYQVAEILEKQYEKAHLRLELHTAGYENHFEGPGMVFGVEMFEVWNDAKEITPKILEDIEKAKQIVKIATDKEPSLFFIGGQT